jgi:hypothetical protein
VRVEAPYRPAPRVLPFAPSVGWTRIASRIICALGAVGPSWAICTLLPMDAKMKSVFWLNLDWSPAVAAALLAACVSVLSVGGLAGHAVLARAIGRRVRVASRIGRWAAALVTLTPVVLSLGVCLVATFLLWCEYIADFPINLG